MSRNVLAFVALLAPVALCSQVVINEVCNRNFSVILDEEEEAEDWVEIYNAGGQAVNLAGYTLSDQADDTNPFVFDSYTLEPGEHLLVFCSGKNRQYSEPFQDVFFTTNFTPQEGWNTHFFDAPFVWDGVSDLVVNTCSYNDQQYTINSGFRQTELPYTATVVSYNDGNDASCSSASGETHTRRPNIRLNNQQVGTGNVVNGLTDYPAPYGNWYWSARNQMLYRAEELQAAGLQAGPINQLAFDVDETEGEFYTYFAIGIKQMQLDEMSNQFIGNTGAYFHTDFKLNNDGETVYLRNSGGELLDAVVVDCPATNTSTGRIPDGGNNGFLFSESTPGAQNSGNSAAGVANAPIFSLQSGVYPTVQSVLITNPNLTDTELRFTTDGSEPNAFSQVYDGSVLPIYQSMVLRARVFGDGLVPSETASSSYLINVSHATPIVSVAVDPQHLYGPDGIFENWWEDWERFAQMAYFDSTDGHPLVFERNTAMQIDGGWGGSRYHPQHSFRLEMAKAALNEEPVNEPLIPQKQERTQYSRLYLRNGSNQYLNIPYKDGALTEIIAGETNNYNSSMRPATVYINGQYFGLYEMREKLDAEFYELADEAPGSAENMDLLSVSAWYNGVLRAVEGDAQNYIDDLIVAESLDPQSATYLDEVGTYFDMEYYTDYMIGQAWIGNTDWPWNNIKIHRSDGTGNRWRFSTIDLELSLNPNGWTDCNFNGLQHVFDVGNGNWFTRVWYRSMENDAYRSFFITRFADLLNTAYRPERLTAIENAFFERFVVEMPNTFARWGDPWNVSGAMNNFINNHEILEDELLCKSDVVRDQLQGILNPGEAYVLDINVLPAGGGSIALNTIEPNEYPWSGIYFADVPVSLTAIAAENHVFSHWEANGIVVDFSDPQWSGLLSENVTFTAVFESTVGVAERMASAVKVYPNPTSAVLHLDAAAHGQAWLVDAAGRRISDANAVVQRESFDVSMLATGIYFVVFQDLNGAKTVVRWVKE